MFRLNWTGEWYVSMTLCARSVSSTSSVLLDAQKVQIASSVTNSTQGLLDVTFASVLRHSGARAHFFCQEKRQEESSHHARSASSPHGQILKCTTCPKDLQAQLWYSTSAPSELKAHSWWDYVIYVAFLKCSSDSSLLKWLKFRITPFTSLWGESHDGGKEGKDVLKDVCKEIEELPPSKPEAIREADHPGMIETFCGNTHRDTSARGKLC